ncbi:MAG TPA: FliM/FliN family flagellar motor C-terminal domain-containing protein [Candidatus Dormibacteraeota bacterium]|nr:FliM/FliN family flagellar motor C-terminal domain-containing protein [Candidatus Dormibacteraeota bacterium]
MRFLAFPPVPGADGAVRDASWEARSLLPLSAAALVAAGVRERLQGALAPVEVRLLAPRIPSAESWATLLAEARIDAVRGTVGVAAFITRPSELRTLIGLAFGVEIPVGRALSGLESEVFERFIRLLAPTLAPLCGGQLSAPARVERSGFHTYFELLVEGEACGRLGVALECDPEAGRATGALPVEAFADAQLELRARAFCAELPIGEIAAWAPGALLPFEDRRIEILANGEPLACGELGVRKNRFAVAVGRHPDQLLSD